LKDSGLSRREFVLAAGSGALFAVTGMNSTTFAETGSFTALTGRCGTLRLGYSCLGDVPEALVEARHREQLAFLLAVSGHESMPSFCAKVGQESSQPVTRITSLTCDNGMRLEVVTSSACLNGPEMTLRGDSGSIFVDTDALWFDAEDTGICAWHSNKNALPDEYREDFLACRERAAITGVNHDVVELLLLSAVTA